MNRWAALCILLACFGCHATPQPKQVTVLAFSAAYCAPCLANEPGLAELERQGVTVRRIDVDRQLAITAQWAVTQVPTYIVVSVTDGGVEQVGRTSDLRTLFRMLRFWRRFK